MQNMLLTSSRIRTGKPFEVNMTYGMASDALRGANHYRLFYSHLDFFSIVFVYLGDEEERAIEIGGIELSDL